MITGLAYLLASLSLSVILFSASSNGHETPSEDVAVFAYQNGYVRIMAACVGAPIVLAIAIYMVSRHPASNLELSVYCALGAAGATILYAAYRYAQSYRVELSASGISVTALGRKRVLLFSEVLDACLAEGGKGFRSIRLRPKADPTKPMNISETLSDFDVLVDRLRKNLEINGLLLENRDRWGRRH